MKESWTVRLSIKPVSVNSVEHLIFIRNSAGRFCMLFCFRRESSNTALQRKKKQKQKQNQNTPTVLFKINISLIWPVCDNIFHDTIIPVNFTTCRGRHVAIRMHPECVQLVQLKGNNGAYRHGRLPFKLATFPLQIFLPLNISCYPSPTWCI